MRGTDTIYWVVLALAATSIAMSLLMMNSTRDVAHKATGSSSNESRLATANMYLYGILIAPLLIYVLFAWFLCNRDYAISNPSNPSSS